MFAGQEYVVFSKMNGEVTDGVSTDTRPMFFLHVEELRKIPGYVQFVFNTMKKIESELYDQYYGFAEANVTRKYDWVLCGTKVNINSIY